MLEHPCQRIFQNAADLEGERRRDEASGNGRFVPSMGGLETARK
jgi:hypothetical protein